MWQKILDFFRNLFKKKESEVVEEIVVSRPEVTPPVVEKKWQDFVEGTLEWYLAAWKQMGIDPGFEERVSRDAKTVLAGKSRYEYVSKKTGIPWWVIGCIHFKEATCSFYKVLHNGETLASVDKYGTQLVPKGRGKGLGWTWEEAAIDAINMNGSRWSKIKAGNHSISEILYACERYNGTGYISGAGRAETSPYLWARTTINDDFGKYVSDGKFDSSATTQKTSGVAALAKELQKMGHIQIKES